MKAIYLLFKLAIFAALVRLIFWVINVDHSDGFFRCLLAAIVIVPGIYAWIMFLTVTFYGNERTSDDN